MVETAVVAQQSERMSNLIGYLRKPAKGTGHSLKDQRRMISTWAAKAGHEIAAWCQDETSAADDDLDRPGYRQAVDEIEAGTASGVVIVWLDQFGRQWHIREAAMIVLWSVGAEVFSVAEGGIVDRATDDPLQRMARLTHAAVMGFERIDRAGKSKKAGRRPAGAAPYGYVARDGALIAHEGEQAVLARMRALRSEGGSYAAVAEALNAEGMTTKRGGLWIAQQVHATVNGRAGRRPAPTG